MEMDSAISRLDEHRQDFGSESPDSQRRGRLQTNSESYACSRCPGALCVKDTELGTIRGELDSSKRAHDKLKCVHGVLQRRDEELRARRAKPNQAGSPSSPGHVASQPG